MFKNISYYFTATVIGSSLSFLLLPFYTKFLTLEEFGIIALSYTLGNFLAGLLSCSLSTSTNRFYFNYKKNNDLKNFSILNSSNLGFIIFNFFFFGLFIFIFSSNISNVIFNNIISKEMIFFSFILGCLSKIYNYLMIIFISQEKAKSYSYYFILNSLTANIFSVLLIYFYALKADGRIFGGIISFLIIIPLLFISQKKNFSFEFKFSELKKSLKLSLPMMPETIVGLINNSFDKIILGNLLGLSHVGLYDLANKFSNVYKQVLDSIIPTWTPYFMNKSEIGSIFSKQQISDRYKLVTSIFMIFAAIIVSYIEEIVTLLTTAEFHKASYIIPIIVFFILIVHCFSIVGKGQILFAKQTKHLFYSSLISCILNILLNYILIPHYGIVGAVLAAGFTGILSTVYILIVGQKLHLIPVNFLNQLNQLLIFALFLFVLFILMKLDIFIMYKVFAKSVLLLTYISFILYLNNFNFKKIYKKLLNDNK
jgi:O-antigen/teichoic acid export membrane protein